MYLGPIAIIIECMINVENKNLCDRVPLTIQISNKDVMTIIIQISIIAAIT